MKAIFDFENNLLLTEENKHIPSFDELSKCSNVVLQKTGKNTCNVMLDEYKDIFHVIFTKVESRYVTYYKADVSPFNF